MPAKKASRSTSSSKEDFVITESRLQPRIDALVGLDWFEIFSLYLYWFDDLTTLTVTETPLQEQAILAGMRREVQRECGKMLKHITDYRFYRRLGYLRIFYSGLTSNDK
jgi:hypothetical protein